MVAHVLFGGYQGTAAISMMLNTTPASYRVMHIVLLNGTFFMYFTRYSLGLDIIEDIHRRP